jgi:hypothetical protein
LDGGIVAVGHVGLVAEVDEALLRKIGCAIRSRLQGGVVEGVEREQCLEDGESADARIEHADGQVAGGLVIAPGGGVESERRFAISMRFDVFDKVGGMKGADEQPWQDESYENSIRPMITAMPMPTTSAVSPAARAWRMRRMPTLPK